MVRRRRDEQRVGHRELEPLDPEMVWSARPSERFMAFHGIDRIPSYFLLANSGEQATSFARMAGDDRFYSLAIPTTPMYRPWYDARMHHRDWVDRIHVGDCLELLRRIPDRLVALVIYSPPYFRLRRYSDDPREYGWEDDIDAYLDRQARVFDECVRVTRDDGSIVVNLGDIYIKGDLMLVPYRFALMLKGRRVRLNNLLTWIKTNPTPRPYDRRMVNATEPFFHFVKGKGGHKYFPERLWGEPVVEAKPGTRIGLGYFSQIEESGLDRWQKKEALRELGEAIEDVKSGKISEFRMKIRGIHPMPFGGQEGGRTTQILTKGYAIIPFRGRMLVKDWMECPVETTRGIKHPARFPREIVEHFITLTTDENDIVLDPFLGSGTTALAAKGLRRRFIGIELNPDYADLARRRLEDEGRA